MENKIFSAESLKFRGNIKYISRTLKLTITNFKYDCMMDLEKKKKEQCEPMQTLRWEEMNVYYVTVILQCINRRML